MTPPFAETRRFPLLYTGANRVMALLGLRPANSYVEVSNADVKFRMGWAFRATIPLSSIVAAAHDHGRVLGWGVHGWRGRWLVNGSSSNIVRVEIEPRARGRVLGLPVQVRTVRVSVVDPDALVAAVA